MIKKFKTDFELNNCLFGSVKLTKNVDLGKYKNSGYGIEPFSFSEHSFTDGSMGENVIILGADMSSSCILIKKIKISYILGEGPAQGLYDTTLTAVAKYRSKIFY